MVHKPCQLSSVISALLSAQLCSTGNGGACSNLLHSHISCYFLSACMHNKSVHLTSAELVGCKFVSILINISSCLGTTKQESFVDSNCLHVKLKQGLVWLRQGGSLCERCLLDVLTNGPQPECAWASVGGGVQGVGWKKSREQFMCLKVKGQEWTQRKCKKVKKETKTRMAGSRVESQGSEAGWRAYIRRAGLSSHIWTRWHTKRPSTSWQVGEGK